MRKLESILILGYNRENCVFWSVCICIWYIHTMCISLHTYPHILFTKIAGDVLFGYFVGARHSK